MDPETRIEILEDIIRSTLWMARRYADGRVSYVTSVYNQAARTALGLDVVDADDLPDATLWAEDVMGREYAALTPEEWRQMMEAKATGEPWQHQ